MPIPGEFAGRVVQGPASKEQANDAIAFFRMAQTEDGKRVLASLDRRTDRPVPVDLLPHGAVLREGERGVFRFFRDQIALGERTLYGSAAEKDR